MPFVARVDARQAVARAPYEIKRLKSAARIHCERTDNPRQFFCKSRSRKDHWWPVDLDGDPMCYCEDNQNTTEQCAHVLKARMASGDMALLQALGDEMQKVENRSKELERTARTRRRG